MGSFSDIFCLKPETLCCCGWGTSMTSLWEEGRFLEMCDGNCPEFHHSIWGCTRGEEPLSPEKKTMTPLPSIHDAPSLLFRSCKDHTWHFFSHSPHPTGQSPGGRVWFDLRSTRLFTLQLFYSWKPLASLLPAGTDWFCVFSTPLRFPEMGAWC